MDLHLNDKHVLITGGSKGIGLACAVVFLEEGAKVSLVSRDQTNLDASRTALLEKFPCAGERIAVIAADLRDAASAARALDQAEHALGDLDILVNSAGAAKRTAAPDLTPEVWRNAMDAKFFTYINMMDPAIKRMASRKRGVIVNVVGAGGKVASTVHISGGSANAALMLASAGMAAAYAPLGIRVNAVCPTTIDTPQNRAAMPDADASRWVRPAQIAEVMGFLLSGAASAVSGQLVQVGF